MLATTASVLQHWFSRTDHQAAGDPYFLYVASNIGSFVALAAYPSLVEPLLPLAAQSRFWTIGYAVFVSLVAACGVVAWRAIGRSMPSRDGPEGCHAASWRTRAFQWRGGPGG